MFLISHNVSVRFNSITLNHKQSAGYNVLPTRLDDNSEKSFTVQCTETTIRASVRPEI